VTLFRWTEIQYDTTVTSVSRTPAVPPLIRAIGLALRDERTERGWSQEMLCDRAGMDRTYLSGIERGARSPNLRALLRICDALGVPFSRIVIAAEGRKPAR